MGAGSSLRSVAILFSLFGRCSDTACGGLERAKLSCADAFLVQPVLRHFWCRSDTSTSRGGHSSVAFSRRTLRWAICPGEDNCRLFYCRCTALLHLSGTDDYKRATQIFVPAAYATLYGDRSPRAGSFPCHAIQHDP